MPALEAVAADQEQFIEELNARLQKKK